VSGAGLRLRFHLPEGYPETATPECEASSSELSRQQNSELSALARSTAQNAEFAGRECVFDIVGVIHEAAQCMMDKPAAHVSAEVGDDSRSQEGEQDDEEDVLCCMKLDHMRDEQRYIKHIRSWTRDLGLRGRWVIG